MITIEEKFVTLIVKRDALKQAVDSGVGGYRCAMLHAQELGAPVVCHEKHVQINGHVEVAMDEHGNMHMRWLKAESVEGRQP